VTCHHPGHEECLADHDVRVALIGSPNAGKTTIFNGLTGFRAKTGNYPGVTVTRSQGTVTVDGRTVVIEDLPGTHSLSPVSPDEQVVIDSLEGRLAEEAPPDALIVVADATTIERSLILIAQVLQLGRPTLVVLTMIDELAARGGHIDEARLQACLGVPVVGVVGTKKIGLPQIRELLADAADWPVPVLLPPSDPEERSAWIGSVLASVLHQRPESHRHSEIADRVLLHPVLGVVAFFGVMFAFFQVIFTWAAPLQDAVGAFFDWLGGLVEEYVPWETLAAFLSQGVIAGVGSVLTFLPQIILLFLMISFLENVGYMSRAAFLMDRVMGRFGLEGRAFVSLLSSYACAVPGIMSTRTIPSSKDRIATIMVAPLMTCSARLPVYTLLIAAFVPAVSVWGPIGVQGLVLFGLYLLGTVSAIIAAAVLKRTRLKGETLPFYMEMPPYRVPGLKLVVVQCWDSARYFVRKAGTIILGTSIILWILLHIPVVTPPAGMNEADAASYQLEQSIAGSAGRAVEPVFEPLGFTWQINVALIGSLSAREVFVSTLGQISAAEDPDSDSSIEATLKAQTRPDGSPVYTAPTVAAILLFFVYALQCMSTVAVMRRETGSWRWPVGAFVTFFFLAWIAAFIGNRVTAAITGG